MRKVLLILICLCLSCPFVKGQGLTATLIEPAPTFLSRGMSGPDASSFHWMNYDFGFGLSSGKWSPNGTENGVIGFFTHKKFGPKFAAAIRAKYIYDYLSSTYTDIDGGTSGQVRPGYLATNFMVSYRLFEHFAAGFGVRSIYSYLGDDSVSNVLAYNLSLTYNIPKISLSLSLKNMPFSKTNPLSSQLPRLVKLDVRYSGISNFILMTEGKCLLNGEYMISAGADWYVYKDMVTLSAGYTYGKGVCVIPSHVSCGVGLQKDRIGLNAAFLLASDTLRGTVLVGMHFMLK